MCDPLDPDIPAIDLPEAEGVRPLGQERDPFGPPFMRVYEEPSWGLRERRPPPPPAEPLQQDGPVVVVVQNDQAVVTIPGLGERALPGEALRELAAALPGPSGLAPDVATVTIGLSRRMVGLLDGIVREGLHGEDRAAVVRRLIEQALAGRKG